LASVGVSSESVATRGLLRLKVLIFSNGFGGPREPKANSILAAGAWRELLLRYQGDLMFAAMIAVADEVQAGFRHYFPGFEFFLSHNVSNAGERLGYSTEVRGGR
jgi:hypothetical protein